MAGGTARGARSLVTATIVALAAPRGAGAAPPEPASGPSVDVITIAWTAPAACPDGPRIDAAVDRLLGGPPPASGRTLRVTGVVTPRDDGAFDLALATEDEGGHRGRRALTGATCEALADAAALVIALGWDPAAVAAARARPAAAEPVGAPAPTPEPPPAPAPPPSPAPAVAPPPPPGRPRSPGTVAPSASPPTSPSAAGDGARAPRIGLGIGVVVEAGGLPGLSVGVAGAASLLLGPYRVEVSGTGIPAAEAALEGDTDRGGRFGQVLGAAAVCRAVAPWRGGGAGHEVSACVGLEGGAILATGFGVDEERDATQPWVAPRAGVSGRLELVRGLALRGDLVVAVPLLRDTFLLDQLGEVHRPAAVSGRAQGGLDLRF